MRLRIDLAYDGTDFHGWAQQPGLRTVQGVIEEALAKILRHTPGEAEIRLTVAGRTDAGVHARHQVCHLDIEPKMLDRVVGHMEIESPRALEYRLRRVVPPDIVIYSVTQAPQGFDARFSALERSYVYRICDSESYCDPRTRSFVLNVGERLNDTALQHCAELIVGLKDFGSFATPNPGGTTIREVKIASWKRTPAAEGQFGIHEVGAGTLEFTIVADAFAHNMVRSLVGAQVLVGKGRKSLTWFADKIATPKREGSSGPIAPCGLSLEHVAYPPDELLASRAQSIRAKRTL